MPAEVAPPMAARRVAFSAPLLVVRQFNPRAPKPCGSMGDRAVQRLSGGLHCVQIPIESAGRSPVSSGLPRKRAIIAGCPADRIPTHL
eukprot:3537229-Pyramimonas_sp.AAC.1